ncbi:transposase [Streptomyces sp. NPDC090231]|uniref:IS110 family transposase n=1 Tax=unclassified Streptomyces TaxID=2593676 RepID=UPI0038161A9B
MTSRVTEHTADQHVFGGVDSHADTVHVAVISDNGGRLADAEFATTAAGYAAALAFLTAHDHVIAIGVEGTSSYGAGFTRTARSHGHRVIEVNRPDRAERRRIGKSDPIDAYAAARAALSGRADSAPKDDTVAGIRALRNAARPAVKARTAALNQIGHVLITAPETVRAKYGQLDARTREYVARQTAAGRTKKEIIRLLKRAIAREIFRCLTTKVTAPGIDDLRQTKNITLTAVAQHFGVWPTTISRLERGLSRDDDLALTYRNWLQTT